jgi:hypothetical protein
VAGSALMGIRPDTGRRRRTCLRAHVTSDGEGTVDAAKKMPVPRSKEDSRTTSEPTSLLRWELISRIISGVKEAARMEDPAGGVSLMPRRVGPWMVCLPLRHRRRCEDEEEKGLAHSFLTFDHHLPI